MKTYLFKGIFTALLSISMLGAFGQASKLTITNTTDCYYELNIHALECGGPSCTQLVCVGPGTTIVNPCLGPDGHWESADIEPGDLIACECQSSINGTVGRATPCTSYVNSPSLLCDDCGWTTAQFTSASEITIF